MAPHEQVWAKVNAPVDRGIAPLIEMLSLFPPLQTGSSCEGSETQPATVTFRYGDGWRELTEFVFGRLGPKLGPRVGDVMDLSVEVTTWGDAVGRLRIRPGCIQQVCDAVKLAAQETGITTLHRSECSDDIPCTSQ